MKSRMMKVALAVAAIFVMSGASLAQSPWWWLQRDRDDRGEYQNRDRDRDDRGIYQNRDRDRDGINDRYEIGLRDGRNDRQHRRAWRPRHPGAAYMNGYRAGFGRDWRQGDDDRWRNNRGPNGNGPYGGNGSYGGYGNQNAQRVAYDNGFSEGQRYGQADRSRGKSYEPTGSGVYKDADRGYNSSYGDKSTYRSTFRNGYLAGYQRGYGNVYRR
jgi:hypothetical protein